MNYIIDKDYIVVINNTIIDRSFKSYVNSLCINNLSTLEGRIKATKKLLNIKYNVPIYVNHEILLFKITNNEEKIWINYFNIKLIDYGKERVVIIFKDTERLNLYTTKDTFKKYVKICNKIEKMF